MNKIMLIGRVGHTPETGENWAKLSLATTEKYTKDGQKEERTDWHTVKFFGKLVDVVKNYVTKGKQIYVEGRMRYDKYTDKNGVEKWKAEVYADNLELLGSRDDATADPNPTPQQAPMPAPAPVQQDLFNGDDAPF